MNQPAHSGTAPRVRRDTPFKIGLVQMSCTTDVDENLRKAVNGIREAAERGAEVICLQELFRSQYFCREENAELFNLAETIPGPSTETLADVAKDLQVSIVASLFEKRAQGLYHNTAVMLDADGSTIGMYRKMHIPDDPLYYEKFYFTPGDLGFKNFETRYARVGVLVCWDQWYPEGARLTSMQGAKRSVLSDRDRLASFGEGAIWRGQLDAWRTIQRAHAIANGVYVAAANRTGIRGIAGKRSRILGQFVCCRSIWTSHFASLRGQRRSLGSGMRSQADG